VVKNSKEAKNSKNDGYVTPWWRQAIDLAYHKVLLRKSKQKILNPLPATYLTAYRKVSSTIYNSLYLMILNSFLWTGHFSWQNYQWHKTSRHLLPYLKCHWISYDENSIFKKSFECVIHFYITCFTIIIRKNQVHVFIRPIFCYGIETWFDFAATHSFKTNFKFLHKIFVI